MKNKSEKLLGSETLNRNFGVFCFITSYLQSNVQSFLLSKHDLEKSFSTLGVPVLWSSSTSNGALFLHARAINE
jgi:hypothetical protein